MRVLFNNYVAMRAAGISAERANRQYKDAAGKWLVNPEGIDGPSNYANSIGKYSIACDLAIKSGIPLKLNGELITWADLKRAIQRFRKSPLTKNGRMLGRKPMQHKDWHSASYQ